MTRLSIFSFLMFLLTVISIGNAQTITVGTNGDYPNLAATESVLSPGDTVIILNETFTAGAQFLNDVNGTAGLPIVIIAETQHLPIFSGGSEAIHLVNCSYIELNGLVIEGQTSNGVNIDDGGDYSTPSTNVTVRNCIFRDITVSGNHDFLKMSGVDDFLIENCQFLNGTGGSGVDMVGCHNGVIQDNVIDAAGITGIQAKGGTQFITIRRNIIKNHSQRGLNLGGNTGLQFFRPPLPNPIVNAFEAADLDVYSNVCIGNWAPVAYVGSVRVKVINNTFFKPENWVMRILQENTTAGFLACADGEFSNNIVYLESDLTEANVGGNTAPSTFTITNNLWFNEASNNWTPNLPVTEQNQLIADPLFNDIQSEDFSLDPNSLAIGHGSSSLSPMFDFDEESYLDPPSAGAFEGGTATVGLDEEVKDFQFLLYPNPTNGVITIESNESIVGIELFNQLGELVHVTSPLRPTGSFNVSGLIPGIYVVQITTASGQSQQKLIVE